MKYPMPVLILSNLVLCQVSSAAGWVVLSAWIFFFFLSLVSACGTLFPSARLNLALVICFAGATISILTLITLRSLLPNNFWIA